MDEVETSKILQKKKKMCDGVRKGERPLEKEKAKSQVKFVTSPQAAGICTNCGPRGECTEKVTLT